MSPTEIETDEKRNVTAIVVPKTELGGLSFQGRGAFTYRYPTSSSTGA